MNSDSQVILESHIPPSVNVGWPGAHSEVQHLHQWINSNGYVIEKENKLDMAVFKNSDIKFWERPLVLGQNFIAEFKFIVRKADFEKAKSLLPKNASAEKPSFQGQICTPSNTKNRKNLWKFDKDKNKWIKWGIALNIPVFEVNYGMRDGINKAYLVDAVRWEHGKDKADCIGEAARKSLIAEQNVAAWNYINDPVRLKKLDRRQKLITKLCKNMKITKEIVHSVGAYYPGISAWCEKKNIKSDSEISLVDLANDKEGAYWALKIAGKMNKNAKQNSVL